MNKFVKLPLFLGVCGAICAGVLAVVNGFTAPIIADNNEKAQNANIYKIMGIEDADKVSDVQVKEGLKYVKSAKEVYVNNEVLGVVYTGFVNDSYSEWTIQLGIKDGVFSGMEYTYQKVDANIGLPSINAFKADIVGVAIEDSLADVGSSATGMVTLPKLRDFVSECAAIYAESYL